MTELTVEHLRTEAGQPLSVVLCTHPTSGVEYRLVCSSASSGSTPPPQPNPAQMPAPASVPSSPAPSSPTSSSSPLGLCGCRACRGLSRPQ